MNKKRKSSVNDTKVIFLSKALIKCILEFVDILDKINYTSKINRLWNEVTECNQSYLINWCKLYYTRKKENEVIQTNSNLLSKVNGVYYCKFIDIKDYKEYENILKLVCDSDEIKNFSSNFYNNIKSLVKLVMFNKNIIQTIEHLCRTITIPLIKAIHLQITIPDSKLLVKHIRMDLIGNELEQLLEWFIENKVKSTLLRYLPRDSYLEEREKFWVIFSEMLNKEYFNQEPESI